QVEPGGLLALGTQGAGREFGAQDVARAALVAPTAGCRRARAGGLGGVGEGGETALIREGRIASQAGIVGPGRNLQHEGAQGEDEREGPHAGDVALSAVARPPWTALRSNAAVVRVAW